MGKGKTVLLIIIALAVLGLIVFMGGQTDQPATTGPGNGTTTAPDGTPAQTEDADNGDQAQADQQDADTGDEGTDGGEVQNQLPPAVFNTSGEITEIGSNYIMVQTDGSHMESGEEVEVRVNVTDSTNLLDANNNSISLSDLSSGDQVSVEASGNIKNSTEFEGSNVKITQ